jgi:leishmanolysin-like peptidase
MRFSTFPDSTITADLPDSKRQMIMNEVVPAVLEFLSLTLSVTPLTQPLLLDTQCSSEGFFLTPTGRQCAGVCESTMCGTVRVPDQHLKACRQCNNDQNLLPNCPFGTPLSDQPGVANSDYALYISADQSACPGGDVLAFAGACQLESSQDRPIAGFINFCPTTLEGQDTAYLFSVAKHELFHALAFSSQLYPYWRDRNGDPRTQRDENGNPPFDSTGAPVADTSTVRTLTYTSWRTASGPTQHTVTALVTEAIAVSGCCTHVI